METIPNEILFHILSYLELDDRKDKRRVNHLWNQMIPLLPLTLCESKKKDIIENMRRISIQIHFADEIISYVFLDERIRTYSFFDLNQKLLFDLSMDNNWETMGNYFTNVDIEEPRWNKIKSDLDEIFEKSDNHIETFVEYMNYLIHHFPEIKSIISSDDNSSIDIHQMKDTFVEDVMAILKNNKKYLVEKNHIFQDIYILEMLKSYRDRMDIWRKNILQYLPKYIIINKDLLEKYLYKFKLYYS